MRGCGWAMQVFIGRFLYEVGKIPGIEWESIILLKARLFYYHYYY